MPSSLTSYAIAFTPRELTSGLDRHDVVAGTIQDQVWRAIQLHHVVILVLSEDSVKSDWVENELEMARNKERAEGTRRLVPRRVGRCLEGKS